MKRTSPTSIARMERLFRQDKLPVEDRGQPAVAALQELPTGTVGVGVAADAAADRVAAAEAGKRFKIP